MTPQQQQLDANGFPEFEPVRIYDAPATILTQIYDGEGSLGRAVRTIMSQESLSPAERDSYAQRIKKAHGGNPVMDTTIDLAMNPLVWLLFLTSPIGRGQFIKTGGKLVQGLGELDKSKVGAKAFLKIAEMVRLTPFASLISSQETTAPSQLVQGLATRGNKLRQMQTDIVGDHRAALLRKMKSKFGVEDFDPTRATTDPAARKFLEELDFLSYNYAAGHLDPAKKAGIQNIVVDTTAAHVKVAGVDKVILLNPDEAALVKSASNRVGKVFNFNGVDHELVADPIIVTNRKTLRAANSLIRQVHGPGYGRVAFRDVHTVKVEGFSVDGLDEAFLRKWAQGHGMETEVMNYLKAGEEYRLSMKKLLFGKTGPNGELLPTFQLDPEKVARIWMRWQRSNKVNPSLEEWALDSLVGMETIDKVLPKFAKQALRRGSKDVELTDVYNIIEKVLGPQLNSAYMPRNTFKLYGKGKVNPLTGLNELDKVGPTDADVLLRTRGGKDPLGVAGVALPRRDNKEMLIDPVDLQIAQRLVGNNMVTLPNQGPMPLSEAIAQTNRQLGTISTGRVATHTFNHELAMRNYAGDMEATISLHGLPITPAQREAVMAALRLPKARQLAGSSELSGIPLSKATLRRLKLAGVDPAQLTGGQYTAPETLTENLNLLPLRQELRRLNRKIDSLAAVATPTPKQIKALANYKKRQASLRGDMKALGKLETRPDIALLNETTPTQLSMADAIDIVMGRESPAVREYFEKGLLPTMFGGTKPTQMFGLQMSQGARKMASDLAKSAPMQWLSKNGGSLGKSMVQQMHDYGNMSAYELDAAHAAGGLTGYLYATHLGFNVASAAWNALQPFQWAATWMGSPEIIKAYGTALKQMGGYLAERAKYGLRIDPQKQLELWQKHVRTANINGRDLLGVGPNIISTFESAIYSAQPQGKPSMLKFLTIEAPLKLFQTAEALNRIVVAEAGLSWYGKMQKGGGVAPIAFDRVLDHVQELQSMVNFSYSPATQMKMFQKGRLLGNPFMRMFLQYPSRTIGNFMLSQQVGGGVRNFGFEKLGGPSIEIPAIAGDSMRMLGLGAVAYEVGKNLLGLDVSPGLSGAAISQLPNQLFTTGLPVPPIIDIPAQLIGGLAEGDQQQIRQAAFRLVPGGVTLQKMLGAMPALPGGGPYGLLQSQYADWTNKTPDGLVPVYRDDGTLQSFDSPLNLVMRGVGADFKKFQSPMEATKFLLANRAEMVDMRRKYKDAVLGNNMSGASVIEAEYKKRYGVPMTVKTSEWDRAVQLRSAPLAERMLDTLPSEMRQQYQQSLSGMSQQFGLPPGGLEDSDTSRQRQSIRQFNPSFNVPGQ